MDGELKIKIHFSLTNRAFIKKLSQEAIAFIINNNIETDLRKGQEQVPCTADGPVLYLFVF